jgi:dsDNA-specific endonuclease/ATPase MutS2
MAASNSPTAARKRASTWGPGITSALGCIIADIRNDQVETINSALEVDLRGMDADEALRAVDQGLDGAVLAGLHELRIIHGVGRGVLRAAVERHLRAHSQVASQRLGLVGEGGRGVTVAVLR